jgi:hypothetical protein
MTSSQKLARSTGLPRGEGLTGEDGPAQPDVTGRA